MKEKDRQTDRHQWVLNASEPSAPEFKSTFEVLDTVDQTSLHPVWRADSGAPPTASGSANAQVAFPQETELKAWQI